MTVRRTRERAAPPDAAGPRARPATLAVAAAAAACIAHVWFGRFAVQPAGLVTLLGAAGALAWLLRSIVRGARPGPRALALACAAVIVASVIVPPRNSTDVWPYAMYGRIVSEHGQSPYRLAPDAFPDDPGYARLTAWHHERTVYGPAFTLVSAAGTGVLDSTTGLRLFFQLLAALATAATLLILWRRARDPGTIALVGLNPVVAMSIVNAGHNDALVGLAVVSGALLVADRRESWAGTVLGLGALVKLVALVPLGAAVVWAFRARGAGSAARIAVPGSILVVGSYVAIGLRDALSAFDHSSQLISPFSIAGLARRIAGFTGRSRPVASAVAALAIVACVAVVFWLSKRLDVTALMGLSLVPFLLVAGYVLPWYVFWILPALALAWRSYPALLVAGIGVLTSIVYWPHPGLGLPTPLRVPIRLVMNYVCPSVLLVALVATAVWVVRARRAPRDAVL